MTKVWKRPLAVVCFRCDFAPMILHNAEAEMPFVASFETGFPYDNASASTLITQGWAISLNAAFCVLNELCRPPHLDPRTVSKDRLRELVFEWTSGPDHPLKAPVLHAANALIDDTPLDWREGVEIMRQVGSHDGQRAALGIVYFAFDGDSTEGDDALEDTLIVIQQRWDAKCV